MTDVATGRTAYDAGGDVASQPASTVKVVTAAAALSSLEPNAVFQTRTVLVPVRGGGVGTVVLVGGGDPTLAGPHAVRADYPDVAQLTDLVASTASRLRAKGVRTVRVAVDDHLFSGPLTAPAWKPIYLTDGDVSPVTALSVDAGRLRPDNNPKTPDVRAADPSSKAGSDLAALLTKAGVHVTGVVRRSIAPAGAASLATVSSPPVASLVVRMLQHSDNDLAEALFRHVAIARHLPATFDGGSAAVRAALSGLHIDLRGVQLADGSGLSLRDRVSPLVLTTAAAGCRRPEAQRPAADPRRPPGRRVLGHALPALPGHPPGDADGRSRDRPRQDRHAHRGQRARRRGR